MMERLSIPGACQGGDAGRELPGPGGQRGGADGGGSGLLGRTKLLGFDQTRVNTFFTANPKGAIGVYDPVTVLQIPAAIEKSEIRELAVMATPEGFFLGQCWWALLVEGGGAQEFLVTSQLSENTGLPPTPTGQTIVSGIRYTQYGSLLEPQKLVIQLAADSKVLFQLWSDQSAGGVALTVYTRIVGYVFNKGTV